MPQFGAKQDSNKNSPHEKDDYKRYIRDIEKQHEGLIHDSQFKLSKFRQNLNQNFIDAQAKKTNPAIFFTRNLMQECDKTSDLLSFKASIGPGQLATMIENHFRKDKIKRQTELLNKQTRKNDLDTPDVSRINRSSAVDLENVHTPEKASNVERFEIMKSDNRVMDSFRGFPSILYKYSVDSLDETKDETNL